MSCKSRYVYIGEYDEYEVNISASDIYDLIVDNYTDAEINCNDNQIDNWNDKLSHVYKYNNKELELKINKAINEFLIEHKAKPNFGNITNIKCYDLETGKEYKKFLFTKNDKYFLIKHYGKKGCLCESLGKIISIDGDDVLYTRLDHPANSCWLDTMHTHKANNLCFDSFDDDTEIKVINKQKACEIYKDWKNWMHTLIDTNSDIVIKDRMFD